MSCLRKGTPMNNHYIRTAMIKADLNQSELAKILGCSQSSVSIMLSRELSKAEQKKIVAMINESEIQNNGAGQNRTLDK